MLRQAQHDPCFNYIMGNLLQHLTGQVGYFISGRLSKWDVETSST